MSLPGQEVFGDFRVFVHAYPRTQAEHRTRLIQRDDCECLECRVVQAEADAFATGNGFEAGCNRREGVGDVGCGIERAQNLAGRIEFVGPAAGRLIQPGIFNRQSGLHTQVGQQTFVIGGERIEFAAVYIQSTQSSRAALDRDGH